MSVNVTTKLAKPVPVMRRVIIYATLLPVIFLLGFVPMWLKSMDTSRVLAETEHQLSLSQTQVNLAVIQTALDTSVIEAQRGNYEPARQAASTFFTALRTETDRGAGSAFTPAQQEAIEPILVQQDAIITLLARNSKASVDRLTDLYVTYQEIMTIK